MRKTGLLLTLISVICFQTVSAKIFETELRTNADDIITITYDVSYKDGDVEIQFINARIDLSFKNRQEYKTLEGIDAVFFDRTGIYPDVKFTNITPEAFMVPSNLKYQEEKKDGYFMFEDKPELSFRITNKTKRTLAIPIYIAHYEKKGKYKILSSTKEALDIEIDGKNISNRSIRISNSTTEEAITTTLEVENPENEEISSIMERIRDTEMQIDRESKLPFTESLNHNIEVLRKYEYSDNNDLKRRIRETIDKYESKKEYLEQEQLRKEAAKEQEAINQIKQQEEKAIARQDSIANVQQQQAEKDKKRTIWMVIGGAILGVLTFVGNQVFQHFRILRNQKSMMDIQQGLARRAEYEAKNQINKYTRRKINDAMRKGRNSTKEFINKKKTDLRNNKNISI